MLCAAGLWEHWGREDELVLAQMSGGVFFDFIRNCSFEVHVLKQRESLLSDHNFLHWS